MPDGRDLSHRLASLPPDRRRLLEMMAKSAGARPAGVTPQSPAATAPVITATQFSVELGSTPPTAEVGRFYDAINGQLDGSVFGEHAIFLNYGYVANGAPQESRIQRLPEATLNKNAVRLILELVGATPLSPEHVTLDVGCGRGGTVRTIQQFFAPAHSVGMDLSPRAIAFCRKVHRSTACSFVVGNAEALPFPSAAFDVVSNVESSHTYNDLPAFYAETLRVLRPGGWFLYTDLMPADRVAANVGALTGLGYVEQRRQDITANVLLSCDEVAGAHTRAFASANDAHIIENFLAVPGSRVYDEMKLGKTRYMLFRFQKGAS